MGHMHMHHSRRHESPASLSPGPKRDGSHGRDTSPLAHHDPASPSPSPDRSKHLSPDPGNTSSPKGARSADRATASHIYLHKNIRVVFAPRALDLSEKLKVVLEGPTGSQVQSSSTSGVSSSTCSDAPASNNTPTAPTSRSMDRYTPYTGPGEEWEQLRKTKYNAEKALERRMQLEDPVPLDPNAASLSPAPSSVLQLSSSSGFSGLGLDEGLPHQHSSNHRYPLLNTPPAHALLATATATADTTM